LFTGTASTATATDCAGFDTVGAGYRCGGGTLDPGEQCDDGNRTDGDGCSASCQIEFCGDHVDGTPCSDGNACTEGDTCLGGRCIPGAPVSCPTCTRCDTVAGCVVDIRPMCASTEDPGHAVLEVRQRAGDARDAIRWSWPNGAATTLATLGDPLGSDGYALCVFDTSGPQPALAFSATAPAGGSCGGSPCWISRANGYDYRDRNAASDGTARVRLRAGAPGKASAAFLGEGTGLSGRPYGLPGLPLSLPLTVQLQGASGACFETDYDAGGVIKNDPGRGVFKARAH
jgi:cysteine-rich repeat protein